MDRMRTGLLVGAGLLAGVASAEVITYTHVDTTCQRCLALGYPVPTPVASQSAVNGFREYASLLAGLQVRATAAAHLREQVIGQTVDGRDIHAFVIGDADTTMAEGLIPEPATLQNGGIHAREWASPEVVAGVIERIDDNAGDGGLHDYLIENLTAVLIPVLNVDGFLQTQRFPNRALESENAGDPTAQDPDYPRDGRMRRKNLLNADEQLEVNGDGMFGVDLNRNNPPRWANRSGTRSSPNPRSIVHHGSGPASEPEIRTLQSAAALGPANRRRLYIDTHSFSRVYFAAYTGNGRRDRNQDRLGAVIDDVGSQRYTYLPSGPGSEIGSTDEYFAYTFQVPSFTLEIEPGPNGASEYGGFGVSHDGFVLPDSEIARVRGELADAAVLAYYHQSGPPALLRAEITGPGAGTVFRGDWSAASATRRDFTATRAAALQNDTSYRLLLQFSKPMRVRDAIGASVTNYPGQSVALAPSIRLTGRYADGSELDHDLGAGAEGWLGDANGKRRYTDDAYEISFSVPASVPLQGLERLELTVTVQDFAGLSLDSLPDTVVDWVNGGWQGYENSSGLDGGDSGGADRSMRLIDDGSPLRPGSTGSGGGGGSGSTWWLLGALFAGWRRAKKKGARGAPQETTNR